MIDSKLQQELRAQFNPEGSEIREVQTVLVDVLKEIDAICRKHDIKYWLGAGTCLGAVRHGGFIPWDDDADVEMMRKDWYKFRKVYNKYYSDGEFALQTRENDLFYTMGLSKFRSKHGYVTEVGKGDDMHYKWRGPFVDIFVVDRNTRLMGSLFKTWSVHLHQLTRIKKPGIVVKISLFILKWIYLGLCYIVAAICRHLPWAKLRFWNGSLDYKLEFDLEDIKDTVDMEFEGCTFKVPTGWDHYLTKIYGNYMEFPPIEDRIAHLHLIYTK